MTDPSTLLEEEEAIGLVDVFLDLQGNTTITTPTLQLILTLILLLQD